MSIQAVSVPIASVATGAPSVPQTTRNNQAAPQVPQVQLAQKQEVEINFDPDEMRQNLQEAVSRLNAQMQQSGRNLSFSVDDRINRTIITIRNLQTGELIRQIPSAEVIRLAHNIEDMKGILFNKAM